MYNEERGFDDSAGTIQSKKFLLLTQVGLTQMVGW